MYVYNYIYILHIYYIGNDRVDIFYRVANPSTICRIRVQTEYYLFTCKKLVMACVPRLLGVDICIDSRQPRIDNRLQCTAS